MKSRSRWILAALGAAFLTGTVSLHAGKVKAPELQDQPDGTHLLVIPDDVTDALAINFPGSRLPQDKDFDPDMLSYYHSNLVGVHPAIAWGDFNGDKKKDYILLLITSDGKLGPACELIVLNGGHKGYDAFRLGEVYGFKDDYVSFADNKLYKGRYRKNGWYINWDKKKSQYVVSKG